MLENNPKREVICTDALEWLQQQPILPSSSIVASLPDISEFPSFELPQWKDWFIATTQLMLDKTPDDGVSIFFQSDIKYQGEWVDKAYLCQRAAELAGQRLLFHRIACRSPAGTSTFGRPAYSHLLCFSRSLKLPGDSSAVDVMPATGEKAWERGMGLAVSLAAVKFIQQHTNSRLVINPFCGHGSVLAAANYLNLEAVGIERSPKRAEKARQLQVSADGKRWQE